MFSFKKKLEETAGKQELVRKELKEKYVYDPKKYFEEKIKLMIQSVNSMTLMNIAFNKHYLLFGHNDRYYNTLTKYFVFSLIICNTKSSCMNIDGVQFIYVGPGQQNVTKNIDFERKHININYLFNLFRQYSGDIEDVKRIVSEPKRTIGYKWRASFSDETPVYHNFTKGDYTEESVSLISDIPKFSVVDTAILF